MSNSACCLRDFSSDSSPIRSARLSCISARNFFYRVGNLEFNRENSNTMNSRKPKQSRPRYLTFWIFDHTFEMGVRLRLIIRAIIKASKTIRVSKSFFGKPAEMQTGDTPCCTYLVAHYLVTKSKITFLPCCTNILLHILI